MNTKLLRSLQVFVAVTDSGSMSVAARELHMTVGLGHRDAISLMETLFQRFDHFSLFLQASTSRDMNLEDRDRNNHLLFEERSKNELLFLLQ